MWISPFIKQCMYKNALHSYSYNLKELLQSFMTSLAICRQDYLIAKYEREMKESLLQLLEIISALNFMIQQTKRYENVTESESALQIAHRFIETEQINTIKFIASGKKHRFFGWLAVEKSWDPPDSGSALSWLKKMFLQPENQDKVKIYWLMPFISIIFLTLLLCSRYDQL